MLTSPATGPAQLVSHCRGHDKPRVSNFFIHLSLFTQERLLTGPTGPKNRGNHDFPSWVLCLTHLLSRLHCPCSSFIMCVWPWAPVPTISEQTDHAQLNPEFPLPQGSHPCSQCDLHPSPSSTKPHQHPGPTARSRGCWVSIFLQSYPGCYMSWLSSGMFLESLLCL